MTNMTKVTKEKEFFILVMSIFSRFAGGVELGPARMAAVLFYATRLFFWRIGFCSWAGGIEFGNL
jgi:hypothetical protein